MADGQLGLPDGALMLHIGPHKTGDDRHPGRLGERPAAAAAARRRLRRRERQHYAAALALTGAKGSQEIRSRRPGTGSGSSASQAARRPRVIISSEFFCERTRPRPGGSLRSWVPAVHVLVTLRPLALILPSALAAVRPNKLRRPTRVAAGHAAQAAVTSPTPSFWRRHHHDALVERWAGIVGPDKSPWWFWTRRPDMLFRTVERLQCLPVGLLDRTPDRSNRSLTVGETELVRGSTSSSSNVAGPTSLPQLHPPGAGPPPHDVSHAAA
jgi:hypothetical protein